MSRSRRRFSRATVTILVLFIGICAICVIRTALHRRSASIAATTATNGVPLSALDVSGSANGPQTQPSAPPVIVALKPEIAPIETATPDSLAAAALPASETIAPTSRPAATESANAANAGNAAWSRLLTNGATDGAATARMNAPTTEPIVTGNGALADAKARVAAGELIAARAGLNDALQSGKLSDAEATAAESMLSDMSQTLIFSAKSFAEDSYAGKYVVKPGESLSKIATGQKTTWELLARVNHLDPRRLRAGASIKVVHGPFFAVVHKKTFKMDVYLGGLPGETGSMYVTQFAVGLGKDDSTPTGLWAIAAHAKLKHPTYYPPEGGKQIEADDPANPLGGYWIALTGVEGQAVGRTSYGIHGTIDPASIGHQASMGCIRLNNADIAMVFDLMVEGQSKVLVAE